MEDLGSAERARRCLHRDAERLGDKFRKCELHHAANTVNLCYHTGATYLHNLPRRIHAAEHPRVHL